jgi:chromosome partitioning protein
VNVLALLNLKGGVGKTSCAVNLSAASAAAGFETLLIDLDPQGSATDHLTNRVGEYSVAEVLMGDVTLDAALSHVGNHSSESAAFCLAPSGGFRLNTAEVSLQARASKNRLRIVIDQVSNWPTPSDFVFLDTGPGLDFLWYNALYACDVVVCPVELQMPSLQGLRRFHQLLDFASEEDGLSPAVYYVPTNNDGRLRESRELLDVLYDQFGQFPEGSVLPPVRYSSALSKAYAQRQSIFDFDSRNQAAEDFAGLFNILRGAFDG